MHSPCLSVCVKVKAHREAGELLTLVFSALVSEFSLFNEHSEPFLPPMIIFRCEIINLMIPSDVRW